ncbi:MAG: hypothetical protein WC916_06885 [Candidatus Woesearchaeota archaeon]
MALFSLKTGLLEKDLFAASVFSDDSFVKTDERITTQLLKFQYDFDHAAIDEENKMVNVLNKITRLDSALHARAEQNTSLLTESITIEKSTVAEIRKVEKLLRKQFSDALQMSRLLKTLIETEFLEMLADIKKPLKCFDMYFSRMREILADAFQGKTAIHGVVLSKSDASRLATIVTNIAKTYESLANHIITSIANDFKTVSTFKTDKELYDHLQNRNRVKRQITGKVRYISEQIEKLRNSFVSVIANAKREDLSFVASHSAIASAVTSGSGDAQILDAKQLLIKKLEESLSEFKRQFCEFPHFDGQPFHGLVGFCYTRATVANQTVIEAKYLQQNLVKNLESLKQKIEKLHATAIIRQQEILTTLAKPSVVKSKNLTGQIEEFKAYQQQVSREWDAYTAEITKDETVISESALKDFTIEKKESEKIVNTMRSFTRKMGGLKGAFLGLGLLAVVGATTISNSSSIGYLLKKDTVSKTMVDEDPQLKKLIQFDETGDASFLNFTSAKPLCAKYVGQAVDKLCGKGTAKRVGLTGDAWRFTENIVKKGGKIAWRSTGDSSLDLSMLKVGDVIGAKYYFSKFKDVAQKFNEEYTHVMVVIAFTHGKPVVAHLYHSPLLGDSVGDRVDVLESSPLFKFKVVIRPDYNVSELVRLNPGSVFGQQLAQN